MRQNVKPFFLERERDQDVLLSFNAFFLLFSFIFSFIISILVFLSPCNIFSDSLSLTCNQKQQQEHEEQGFLFNLSPTKNTCNSRFRQTLYCSNCKIVKTVVELAGSSNFEMADFVHISPLHAFITESLELSRISHQNC